MQKKKIISVFLSALFVAATACAQGLVGFAYGDVAAPEGNEWESPQQLSLNKEQPKAWFFNFATVESARQVLPDASEYYLSLDGTWRFNWVPTPDERPKDFYKSDFDDSKWKNALLADALALFLSAVACSSSVSRSNLCLHFLTLAILFLSFFRRKCRFFCTQKSALPSQTNPIVSVPHPFQKARTSHIL